MYNFALVVVVTVTRIYHNVSRVHRSPGHMRGLVKAPMTRLLRYVEKKNTDATRAELIITQGRGGEGVARFTSVLLGGGTAVGRKSKTIKS